MNAGQLAALIAAGFFAVGVSAAVFVLVRMARLAAAVTALVTSYQAGADDVLAGTRAAVERAEAQLARTGALADGVDQVAASMVDLHEQVSAVAGAARLIAVGLGAPVLRLAAAGHGVRHALALRRSGRLAGRGVNGSPARVGGSATLPALPDRAQRERWRERTERVTAARDRARL